MMMTAKELKRLIDAELLNAKDVHDIVVTGKYLDKTVEFAHRIQLLQTLTWRPSFYPLYEHARIALVHEVRLN